MIRWQRNLIVLGAAQLLTLIGFSSYMTFMPYYIQELSPQSDAGAIQWTAALQTGGAIAMMIAAPIWGSLADRYGRKLMLVRATFFATIIAILMGLAQTPGQLLFLRVLQGMFSGTVAAAMTLVATHTPDASLGRALGFMQMINYVAHAVGPLFGGLAADSFGYRPVFPGAAVLMVVSLVAVLTLVKEDRETLARPSRRRSRVRLDRRTIRQALGGSNTVVLIAALMGTSLAASVLSPVMALYVRSLSPGEARVATLAGALTSVGAVSASLAAVSIGHLGDRFGQKRALLVSIVGVAVVAIPQAFVRSAAQLMVLRAIHGMFMGGVMPTANALLAQATPPEKRGAVFGLSSGAQSGGRAIGPSIGASAAAAWGMGSAFLVDAAIFGLLGALVAIFVRVAPRAESRAPVGAGVTRERVPVTEGPTADRER